MSDHYEDMPTAEQVGNSDHPSRKCGCDWCCEEYDLISQPYTSGEVLTEDQERWQRVLTRRVESRSKESRAAKVQDEINRLRTQLDAAMCFRDMIKGNHECPCRDFGGKCWICDGIGVFDASLPEVLRCKVTDPFRHHETYYFCLIDDTEEDYYEHFCVVLKSFWDENKCLDDRHIAKEIALPDCFIEVSESIFDCMEEVSKGRERLLGLGLEENNDLQP